MNHTSCGALSKYQNQMRLKLFLMWQEGRNIQFYFQGHLPYPGDHRPYDIFHQIDMLWPGLLGRDKYEFAKNYCSVKSFHGIQGKVYKDYSRGVRLEELNVLLKQSVMIRRLKEDVLMQLPPKRRLIMSLVLKRSDFNFARGMPKLWKALLQTRTLKMNQLILLMNLIMLNLQAK